MIVYIVLMAYLLLIASFVLKNHVRVITLRGLGKPRQIRDNIACCLLTAIPLIVFFVIRDLHVGTDTIGIYQNIYFNGYGLNGWTPYLYEGLFKYLIILSAKIVPSFRFFLLVSGCITGIFTGIAADRVVHFLPRSIFPKENLPEKKNEQSK